VAVGRGCASPYEAERASAGRGQLPPAQVTHVNVVVAGSNLTWVVRVRLQPHAVHTPGWASTITKGGCAPGAAGTFLLSACARAGQSRIRGIRNGREQAAAVTSGP